MKSITALLPLALLTLSANAQQDIVANIYDQDGCDGTVSAVSNIKTGVCYYLKEECKKPNTNVGPICDLFKSAAFGDDLSFVATCKGGHMSTIGYYGAQCTDKSNAVNKGTPIDIPLDQCRMNFKLYCSDDPKSNNTKSEDAGIPELNNTDLESNGKIIEKYVKDNPELKDALEKYLKENHAVSKSILGIVLGMFAMLLF